MWSCFIIFSLIQMTTSFKYDIIKITFSRHFCNLSIKRLVFKQFFFRKHWAITLTKCFHHICIYPRLISDKHFFLVQSVALSFPFKTRLEKCHFFTDLKRSKIYVTSIILKDSGIMCNMKISPVTLTGFITNHCFN